LLEQLRFPACEPGQLAECRSPGFTGYVRKTVCSPENLTAPAAKCTPTSHSEFLKACSLTVQPSTQPHTSPV
jgi:hypothetical protein